MITAKMWICLEMIISEENLCLEAQAFQTMNFKSLRGVM